MTRHGPVLLALSVLAIAGWSYSVNYDTRAALDRLSELRAQITEEREALQVLRVEWAYLNAPDRLARLVAEQNDRLALVGLTTDALGHVAAVPYPRGLPARPAPAPEPEALIAAAPDRTPAVPAIPKGQEPVALALADAAVHPESAGLLTSGAAGGAAADGAEAGSEATAAAEKAEALGAEPPPLTMEEAVAMALAEAGVLDEKFAAPSIVPAVADGGTPMPQARPAAWAGR